MTGIRLMHILVLLTLAPAAAGQHAPALVGEDSPEKEKPRIETPSNQRRSIGRPLLRIGDPAPAIHLSDILQGSEDTVPFAENTIGVVEFWATWCAPCVAGMPHLTEIQRRYARDGVAIIGVTREDAEVVRRFMAGLESSRRPQYAIATDLDGRTTAAYMSGTRRQGIPCAFIVDRDGRLAWHGRPQDLDAPLRRVVEGRWDLDQARREQERGERILQLMTAVRREVDAADSREDHERVLERIDDLRSRGEGDLGLELERFRILIGVLDDPRGYDLGWDLLEHHPNEPSMLSGLASLVLDERLVASPDLTFALAAAKAANRASAGSDPWVLATLSRAYRRSDDRRNAERFARRALARVPAVDRERLLQLLEGD